MLDHDISTADALRLLSVSDDDPSGFNRRQFLKMVGYGVGGGVALGALGCGLRARRNDGPQPWRLLRSARGSI